ncbi:hypothetical protein B4U37_08225 [Sutcliffiella horikoshii]|uniref:Uncharacterized protein n=1 Tax=Sutcliffiella horikoshii TaxID=79883 RepID=A0ABM6KI20_9BACI|nr:hypothetical protein B4U37_08225 [Sutcliffiella horikoshii]
MLAHPFSYYLIFCPVCEVSFLENLDISEKIVETLLKCDICLKDIVWLLIFEYTQNSNRENN